MEIGEYKKMETNQLLDHVNSQKLIYKLFVENFYNTKNESNGAGVDKFLTTTKYFYISQTKSSENPASENYKFLYFINKDHQCKNINPLEKDKIYPTSFEIYLRYSKDINNEEIYEFIFYDITRTKWRKKSRLSLSLSLYFCQKWHMNLKTLYFASLNWSIRFQIVSTKKLILERMWII